MEFKLPSSPRQDMVMKAPSKHPPVPPLFKPGELSSGRQGENDEGVAEGEGNGERWFFNMKVHHPPSHNYPPSHEQPRKNHHLDPVRQTKASRGHAKKSREQNRATRDQGRAAKPILNRHRKLGAIDSPSPTIPSPAELREQIDIQTARSIGDSLIFHNIPERCEDTPEAEVVKFCQDYLVGRRRINHVHFGHVHKMEDRFGKDAPITARFTLTMPGPADQQDEEKYQPLPYIPPVPRRKLPILRGKNRRKTVYSADL